MAAEFRPEPAVIPHRCDKRAAHVLLKYYFDQQQRKREYTTSLLLNLNANLYLAPVAYRAFKLAESRVDCRTALSEGPIAEVEQTLDYLEFVAVCHRQKIVDTETLIRQEGTPILELWRAAQPWIEDYRERVGSNSIYHELERLVSVIERKRPTIYGKLTRNGLSATPKAVTTTKDQPA